MLYTEEQVRHNLRNREGKRVFFLGKEDRLTPGARDFLSRERIPILPAEQARQEEYRLLSGGVLREKPEHMTHLNGEVLVPKTHPRIGFRGAVDTLEAELLLCAKDCPGVKRELGELLALARQLIRCDVLEEPVKGDSICGMNEEELQKASHFPQDYYGQPHFMPEITDSDTVLRLNRVRCAVRNAERAAAAAFADREGNPTRVDILRAMNRMSSMVYLLMIQAKAEQK